MDPKQYFDNNGYVVLTSAISKKDAEELTKHIFSLYENGKTENDDQCPLSDAVYGDPKFDELLVRFAEPLGKQLGRKLLPTYSYARIYRPGDILKKHKDRASCEISTTLTLGYDAKNNWPIYFEGKNGKELPIELQPGDMAAYKGTEMVHWRQPFKGNWHAQVFLHYVDADGPYADHAMDGRESFGTLKQKNVVQSQVNAEQSVKQNIQDLPTNQQSFSIFAPHHGATYIPNNKDVYLPGYFPINSQNIPELMFTQEECDKIISIANESYSSAASVGGNQDGGVVKNIRSAYIYSIDNTEEYRWIFDKIAKIVSVANTVHYDYDVSAITHSLQLIHYPSNSDVKGHYDWHVDAGNGEQATRKISFTMQLSDPDSYTGCDLIVNDHGTNIQATRERGSISLFPSYMPHVVTPIETGDRYALVIWVHGSRRFK